MTDRPSLSLVIAVYNRPEVLRLVLAACARQSFRDFEIIVADDGSGPDVRRVVTDSMTRYGFRMNHIWHEDAGWRKNVMLNSAVRSSISEYLVFIDGDCLPGRDFILDHWREREPGRILLGRRVETSPRWSASLTEDDVASGRFERIGLAEIVDGIEGKAVRLEDGVRVGNRLLRKILLRGSTQILGSNFSVHKKDLIAINGFDELYDGPGHGEDSDIQYRLSLVGVTGKSLRNLAIQFHVYHKRTLPSGKSLARFEEVRKSTEPKCRFGLTRM